MRFLIDEQLPPALVDWLARHGQEAEHVYDLSILRLSDHMIVARAVEIGAVILTKDEDFRRLAGEAAGVRVVWLRVGNLPNRQLFERIETAWPAIMRGLESGEAVVTAD